MILLTESCCPSIFCMPLGLYGTKENSTSWKHSRSHQRSSDAEDSVSTHLPALAWHWAGCLQLWKQKSLPHKSRLTTSSQQAHVLVFCVVFLDSSSFNSLFLILWFVCLWKGSKHFGVMCVGCKHYSKDSYFQADMRSPEIDPDCKLNERNFPRWNFWRILIFHLPPEKSTLISLSAFSTQPDCLP